MDLLCLRRSILYQFSVSQRETHLTAGQIVVGYMCDKMPYVQVMLFSALFSAIAAFTLLGFASSLPLIFVFVVIFGSLVHPIAAGLTLGRWILVRMDSCSSRNFGRRCFLASPRLPWAGLESRHRCHRRPCYRRIIVRSFAR